MITLKSGICSKDSCISHAKLLGKRARFRVHPVTAGATVTVGELTKVIRERLVPTGEQLMSTLAAMQ